MDRLVLPSALERSQRVLIAGAGGGFDVYAGLPIYERLRSQGKTVFLSNLSFTQLRTTTAIELHPCLFEVDLNTKGEELYFPERSLARFLSQKGNGFPSVYAIENVGAKPVRKAYAYLASMLDLDAVVLVDGGTDILLRGDELSLGTPAEDAVSLSAIQALELPTRMVACLGFGVDTFHGVCHASWLENVAGLMGLGASLGAALLVPEMPEAQVYLDAVVHAELEAKSRASIVNGSIASAIGGEFGDFHRSLRTRSSSYSSVPSWQFSGCSIWRA